MSTRGFTAENQAARAEFEQLLAGLDEAALQTPVGTGWTVATTLCHLAFWDQRAFYLLREWQKGADIEPPVASSQTVESLNHSVNTLAKTVPGSAAVRLFQESAAAVDAVVAELDDEAANRIAAAGFERYLRRALHRREHLARIREAISARK